MADGHFRLTFLGRWGTGVLPGDPWMRATVLLLLCLAGVLRCWRYWDMPFMHDELSALVRLYPTLEETVLRGVMAQDTHPPGVQVFEWIWTRLFGLQPVFVKLPFILMSLAALSLLYRTAMAWTSASTALIMSALMAVLQYSILYGQLARPYAVGLFTTALFADQATRWLAFGKRRAWWGMLIGMVLSAYTHHFALLLVGLMGISLLFLTPPARKRSLLLMLGASIALYAPNLPIFWGQLQLGGLGSWLAVPGVSWPMDHLWWVAHTTWWLAAPLLALAFWAVIRYASGRTNEMASWPILLTWGLAPMIIGLAYSVWRAPVIQHSMLLFSFPYLVLAVYSGLSGLGRRATLVIVVLIALLGTATLVRVRWHYELTYANNYVHMLRTAQRIHTRSPGDVLVLFDAPPEQLDLLIHQGQADPDLPHIRLRDNGRGIDLDSLLQRSAARRLVYGESNGSPPEQLAAIQQVYPHIEERYDLAEGTVLVLDRDPGRAPDGTTLLSKATPGGRPIGTWEIAPEIPLITDAQGVVQWDMDGREYGVLCEMRLDTVTTMPQDQIEVIARLRPGTDAADIALVVELRQNDATVFYRTDERAGRTLNDTTKALVLIVATRPEYAPRAHVPVYMRAYLHVRDRAQVGVLSMEVRRRDGNPVLYGITSPITGPWTHRP